MIVIYPSIMVQLYIVLTSNELLDGFFVITGANEEDFFDLFVDLTGVSNSPSVDGR